jgi:hypothetical protein
MDVGLGINEYCNIIPAVTGATQGGGFGTAKIIAWVIFGAIGFIAFSYGKKSMLMRPMVLGALLMIYPYFVFGAWPLYIVGGALTAALYFWRE